MTEKSSLPLGKSSASFPDAQSGLVYRAQVNRRDWSRDVVEPMPLYPHSVEFCRHYSRWWYRDAKSRYALIICVPKGILRYRLDGKSLNVCGNDVLLIPPGMEFYFETLGDGHYQKNVLFLLGFNLNEILETLNLKECKIIHLPDLEYITGNFCRIYDLMEDKSPEARSEMSGITLQVLNYLSSYAAGSSKMPPLLGVLKSRFSNDFGSKLDLESAAAEFGISSKSINRMFKQYLGVTPGEFRHRARNRSARELLQTTSLSIKEIADKLGFSSQFYFCTLFKKDNQISPREFRKQHFK